MNNKPKEKWYFKTPTLIMAFLCFGPFALVLLWFNPRFSPKAKVILSAITIALTYYLGVLLLDSLKSITSCYKTIF